MKKYVMLFSVSICVATFIACDKTDAPGPSSDKYFPEVKSIIQANCMSCHSSAGTWQGRPTAFDTDSAIALQFMAIKAAVADPISPVNRRMPQEGMLSAHDIEVIVKWFDKGGKITD